MRNRDKKIGMLIASARRNYCAIYEYFNGHYPSLQWVDNKLSLCEPEEGIVEVPMTFLIELELYLMSTFEAIQQKFATSNLEESKGNQYYFLRNLWIGHSHRSKNQKNGEEKIDGINQVVSMIKMRMRLLTAHENESHSQVWSKLYEQSIRKDDPVFEKYKENLGKKQMHISELTEKLRSALELQKKEESKNKELQQKITSFKQKCKKAEKQVFEVTKKKAKVEKKLFDMQMETGLSHSILLEREKQNEVIPNPSHLEGVKAIQQPDLRTQNCLISITEGKKDAKLTIQQKYRHSKKTGHTRHPTVGFLTPNSSLDSIKNVKFERTNSKKALIVSRTELNSSIRYNNNIMNQI